MKVTVEFVVNIGCMTRQGTVETISKSLGDFVSDESSTAYQKLVKSVLQLSEVTDYTEIIWVMVGFISIQPGTYVPLVIMTGTLEWFQSVQYFKKLVGSEGVLISEPVSCGFIDYSRNLRVELENGVIQLSSI